MRPKEIQEKLGIDADRIKLFKREGVFAPENPPSGNRATNYTETDYENLRLLVVLTKSGLTCSDIRKLQDNDWTLEEAIVARRQSIDAEIARKSNSLALLAELLDDKAEFETFETEHYWNVITKKEAEGEEFIDVGDMYDYWPVSLIRDIQCPYCKTGQEIDLDLKAMRRLVSSISITSKNEKWDTAVYDCIPSVKIILFYISPTGSPVPAFGASCTSDPPPSSSIHPKPGT